nr:CRE-SRA-37 protein [Haemonchus contortus]
MVLERAIALWKREQYESYGPQLGIISVIVSIGASIGVMAWAVQKENFVTHSFYCSTVTAQTADRISLMSYGLCVLDLITLLGIIFLNIFNNFTMKWFKKLFNLQSYQLRENAHVIRVMLPLTIFQTVCYLLFSILSVVIVSSRDNLPLITYQTLIVLIYLIPYYTAVSPIIIWYIIRWSRKMREIKLENLRQQSKTADNELYFRELSKMWNAVPVQR